MLEWPSKDPDEYLDYMIIWSSLSYDEDYIDTTTAKIIKGGGKIEEHQVSRDPKQKNCATVTWISGGNINRETIVLVTIYTKKGRILQTSVTLPIVSK